MNVGDILPGILAECGINDTSPQIGNTDFQMRQLTQLMNAAGRDINTRAEWAGSTRELTVVAGSSVALPDDFQEMAEGGAVVLNKTSYRPVRPVVDPTMWQFLTVRQSGQTFYHIKSGSVHFAPEIDEDGATVRYVSRYWIEGDKEAVTSNEDVPVFPAPLLASGTVWRWKRQKGLPYQDLLAEFEADLEAAVKADRGAA